MNIQELISGRRTIRKFLQKKIPENLLLSYVESARLSPSGANLQPLKYVIIQSKEKVSAVSKHVRWAGYLNGTYTPSKTEQPTAYIAVMKDNLISTSMAEFDAGAAIMTINLRAEADGIGCCIMGAIERESICQLMNTPDNLSLMYILALGYKGESPTYVDMDGDDVKYFLTERRITVPKRKISDILTKI